MEENNPRGFIASLPEHIRIDSDLLFEAILDTINEPIKARVGQYFESILSILGDNGRIRFFGRPFIGEQAGTLRNNNTIDISLGENIYRERISIIIAHELGEADYLAHGFFAYNVLMERFRIRETTAQRMTEIFSHNYLLKRLVANELGELIDTADYPQQYINTYRGEAIESANRRTKIIYFVWLLITYPHLRNQVNEIDDYNVVREAINEIMHILDDFGIYDSVDTLVECCNQINGIMIG